MKKYFMFAAVVTAGMLASCSSESLTGSDPKIETPDQADLVPIEIGVATPSARSATSATTRGTGTVGGVDDGSGNPLNDDGTAGGAANVWAGQTVNVYMFVKGTLNLAKFTNNTVTTPIFNNSLMLTPSAVNSGFASCPVDSTVLSSRKLVKYYPQTGQFDFWGYRIDDAVITAPATYPALSGDKYTVEITVDGSQDVLGAKTVEPTPTALSGAGITSDDLYSAKAARAGIQPELKFNHMMTRLTFDAFPGSAAAKTVFVCGISVRPISDGNFDGNGNYVATEYKKNKGTFAIAGTGTFEQGITWDTETAANTNEDDFWLDLKKRTLSAEKPLTPFITDNTTTPPTGAMQLDKDNGSADITVYDGTKKLKIGESIIAPDAKAYELRLLLAQKVKKYEDSDLDVPADVDNYQFNTIKTVVRAGAATAPSFPAFLAGYSYNFKIKVFGLENIQITTTLAPWLYGEEIQIIGE